MEYFSQGTNRNDYSYPNHAFIIQDSCNLTVGTMNCYHNDISSHILYYLHSTFIIIGKVSNELERYVKNKLLKIVHFLFF